MARLSSGEEEKLLRKLFTNIAAVISIIVIVFASFAFFAPKIGSLFGFVSKYRNDIGINTAIKPNSPVLAEIPKATKEKEITIKGYAQPGLTIILYINGPEKGRATTGNDGLFTFDKVELSNGKNTIFAKALDAKNIESERTPIYTISVDKDNPKIEIESPKEGEVVRNLDKRIRIRGKSNEKITLKINGKLAVVKPDLTFDFLLGVNEGGVEIKIEAVDEAQNKTEQSIRVTYEKKSG
jgi:hypothetical protein